MKTTRTVLISGAGVAGPVLAYWLRRHGFTPTVVERAPAVRAGGYAVDVTAAALAVTDRMGLLAELSERRTGIAGLFFVDGGGRVTCSLDAETLRTAFPSDDIEIMRGELASVLHDATKADVEYVFGDSIRTLHEGVDGVDVELEHAGGDRFDLVVGADGLHSTVRRLTFGPEERYTRYLGYHVAVGTVDNRLGLRHWAVMYNAPGRSVGVYPAAGNRELKAVFIIRGGPPEAALDAEEAQKQLVADAFATDGWEVPTLLEQLRDSADFYFDAVSQVRMPQWSSGRVALVGDAAHSPSLLSGQGTALAMVGSYLLAGELAKAGGDHRIAFPCYQAAHAPYARHGQRRAVRDARVLVPGSVPGIWARDRLVGLTRVLAKLGHGRRRGLRAAADADREKSDLRGGPAH